MSWSLILIILAVLIVVWAIAGARIRELLATRVGAAVVTEAETLALPVALNQVPTAILADYLSARLKREADQAEAAAKSQALLAAFKVAHETVSGPKG